MNVALFFPFMYAIEAQHHVVSTQMLTTAVFGLQGTPPLWRPSGKHLHPA